jgi:hypothetical protein
MSVLFKTMDWKEINQKFLLLLSNIESALPAKTFEHIQKYLAAGEWRLAYEDLSDVLNEKNIALKDSDAQLLQELNTITLSSV